MTPSRDARGGARSPLRVPRALTQSDATRLETLGAGPASPQTAARIAAPIAWNGGSVGGPNIRL
jgi:hypothetical protein